MRCSPTRAACSIALLLLQPDPTNYAQLQANLFLNGAETAIEARQLAVSDGERTFGLALRSRGNRGATRLVETQQVGEATRLCGARRRAVRLLRQLPAVKMDVEGHELEAIEEGMVGLLAKNRCIIQALSRMHPGGDAADGWRS